MNMTLPAPGEEYVERFRSDLDALADGMRCPLGVAVSGGSDSLALLLLAAAAFPGRVEAATVDHGLRKESGAEALVVADVAGALNVPHAVLEPGWEKPPVSNVPAAARAARYDALCGWAAQRRLAFILTAHHLDDQAETLLMRLGRGSGLSGLAGVRPVMQYVGTGPGGTLLRPLLGWRKAELVEIVRGCGLTAVQDSTNDDDRLDRTHARRLLAATPRLDPTRLAACAANLADAEAALAWTTEYLFEERKLEGADGSVMLPASDLPREFQRRLLLRGLHLFTEERAIPGPKVDRLLESLRRGESGMLNDVRVFPGSAWRFELAPPRRR